MPKVILDTNVIISAFLKAESDPADNKFLECTLESQADYLITGNTRHFPLKKFHGTRIITPRDFIDLIGLAISPMQT